jgi:hypothetical protein
MINRNNTLIPFVVNPKCYLTVLQSSLPKRDYVGVLEIYIIFVSVIFNLNPMVSSGK